MTNRPDQPDPTPDAPAIRTNAPESVTGVQLSQGIGVREARGFWAEAWSQVIRRWGARFGLAWVGILTFFACYAPLLANGHPYVFTTLDGAGNPIETTSPLMRTLTPIDVVLALFGVFAPLVLMLPSRMPRSVRLALVMVVGVQAGLTIVGTAALRSSDALMDRLESAPVQVDAPAEPPADAAAVAPAQATGARSFPGTMSRPRVVIPVIAGLVGAVVFLFVTPLVRWPGRVAVSLTIAAISSATAIVWWNEPLPTYPYHDLEVAGEARAVYAPIPFSPAQRRTNSRLLAPGESYYLQDFRDMLPRIADEHLSAGDMASLLESIEGLPIEPEEVESLRATARTLNPEAAEAAARLTSESAEWGVPIEAGLTSDELAYALSDAAPPPHPVMGTDSLGQSVASQMMHACRLAISIGVVSTGISVFLGVTLGALMGYFGGIVDLLLFRVVEIFMAIPLLFLLILAAGVLPKNVYVMMAIIGCFTWPNAARFIRAEFFKLREQDFVQAARAVGLPTRAILFRHMLPNGVTPVLVDTSFAIALAILFESTLSYLGLGPEDQASWGRLLSDATNQVGTFVPHLAIFPGIAIFLSVLAFTLIGEALRDAIDPKLKKARV